MRISDWSSDVCSSDLRSCCRDGRKARPAFPLSAIAADVAQVPARLLVGRKSFLAGERQRQAAAEPVARSGAGSQERHEDRCRLPPVALGGRAVAAIPDPAGCLFGRPPIWTESPDRKSTALNTSTTF